MMLFNDVIEDACGDVTGRSPNLDSSGRCGKKGWGDGRVESVRGAILGLFGGKLGQTKNGQNVLRSVPKSVPEGVPEGFWRGPGVVLEGSPSQDGSEFPVGALLGSLLEPTWAILAPSWAPLEPT